ncbi:MAG: ferrous iron transport protein B [Prosthecobacter sp.]|jgi:ferrous iron transport protein B|uniref:ferrous iron transport protein B n=1 Tax=Prosthecobacter sp. TaxID=1965333 RepID=UPI0019E0593D|nr:ferrous iron transport protein B [Prosthecobacter sp.]MBE2285979.1 ferrous iron transport protein B [Prosthecobacter sp.]
MSTVSSETPLIAIVGNPNSGKTTLFNLLTGLKQKVANYPGVTVEKKIGECYSQHGKKLRLIDLPGAYSLNARSPDEAVLRDVLLGRRPETPRPDRVVCVIDSANIERNLYLVSQVLELGLPTILVLNMVDVAEQRQWRIDAAKLGEILGIPVIKTQAVTGQGMIELKLALSRDDLPATKWQSAVIPEGVRAALEQSRGPLCETGAIHAKASLLEPLYLLSDHDPTHYGIADSQMGRVHELRKSIDQAFPGWEDDLVAERYQSIEKLCAEVLRRPDQEIETITTKLDRIFLHPVLGFVNLAFVFVLLGYLIFSVASVPMEWIDGLFGQIGAWVESQMPPGDLRDLMVNGVVSGVGGVVIFLPQIVILFFFIGLMEDTGYMARLAFIMDWLMSKVGLNGKSFLPFLSSYACAVPGVMAARTIDSPKDRLVTILIAPLASCSARLPVYTLLIGLLFPSQPLTQGLLMMGLYALGTGGAFVFAWIFSKGIMKGDSSPMILEMPPYKRPALRSILLLVWQRAKAFLVRAGSIILGISILIWAASTYPKTDTEDKSLQLANSFAGQAGHLIEPAIKPLGYDWKIGIGLIGSFAAREVFNTTMGVVYAVESEDDENLDPLREKLASERRADGKPVYSPLVCLSLLVFYVFAMQCVSTIAIVKRETGSWKWALIQLGYMTGTAYLLSLLIFQVGTAMGY